MCGIVGILGTTPVAPLILEALKRLEYRGYDSAGVATLESGRLTRRRAEGKLRNLEEKLDRQPLSGRSGIGHTRWATHGAPTETNAHPHATDRLALVHNGIIENFRELKSELEEAGVVFSTETDTEVIAHLVTRNLQAGMAPPAAVAETLGRLEGAFALAILFDGEDDLMIGARRGSPLAIGHGHGEMFFGSDAIALAPFTDRITYLEDGDWAVITRAGATVFDEAGKAVARPTVRTLATQPARRQGQPPSFHGEGDLRAAGSRRPHARSLPRLRHRPDGAAGRLRPRFHQARPAVDHGLRYGLLCRRRCQILVRALRPPAGRHRYRLRVPLPRAAACREGAVDRRLPVGRDGRHARLAALCQGEGQKVAAIVNVPTSTIAREADFVLPTLAGPEIGVASTKAFTSQLAVLGALAVAAGRARGVLSREDEERLVHAFSEVPRFMSLALHLEAQIERMARGLSRVEHVLYLGRGTSFPIALEGALKLKEISYIHAEGYAAGELKHGPIALIDKRMPVVVIAPYDRVFEKTVSNMQEVAARGGKIILVTDPKGRAAAAIDAVETLILPEMPATITPLVYAIPVQLLAYHTAVFMGTDVDQPRNLAKSVTVE